MQAVSSTHKKLGERIKELRKKEGMSQEKLADEVEIDRSYMGFLERGERNATLNKLKDIAKALKISLAELFKDIPS